METEIHKKMGYKFLPIETEKEIQSFRKKEGEIVDMINGLRESPWVAEGKKNIQIGFMCLRKAISEGAIEQKKVREKGEKWTKEGLERHLKTLECLRSVPGVDSSWLDEQIVSTKRAFEVLGDREELWVSWGTGVWFTKDTKFTT